MEGVKVNPGGGSGGGEGDRSYSAGAAYQIGANEVVILAMPQAIPADPTSPVPCQISMVAASGEPPLPGDGQVRVRGAQGVRITTGPDEVVPADSPTTNGVEIEVPEEQTVMVNVGETTMILSAEGATIAAGMTTVDVTAEGINLEAGLSTVAITPESIEFQVAEGLSSITLTPEGIVLKGVIIQIN